MLRISCGIALILFCTIFFVQSETDSNSTIAQETIVIKEATEAQETGQDPTETPQFIFKPRPRYKASLSGHVDEEGDFAFLISSEENDYSINIYGGLIINNITMVQTVQIFGEYKFGNITINFKANEIEGFSLLPLIEIQAGPPIKVVASILGK